MSVAAQPVAQHGGDVDEQVVTGGVAEGVVDLLEVVEVEQQQRAALAVALAELDVPLQRLVERAPVGETRQGVVVGQVREGGLVAAPLRHVEDVDQHQVVVRLVVGQQPAAEQHVDDVCPRGRRTSRSASTASPAASSTRAK